MTGGLQLSALGDQQIFTILIVSTVLAAATLIAVTAIIVNGIRSITAARLDASLKRDMLARGLPAESIAQVINTRSGVQVDLPCASAAVVEQNGEWLSALVLQVSGDRYYVHYIGNTEDENEWVTTDRIRFPVGSPVPAFVHDQAPYSNGTPVKEPALAEV